VNNWLDNGMMFYANLFMLYRKISQAIRQMPDNMQKSLAVNSFSFPSEVEG